MGEKLPSGPIARKSLLEIRRLQQTPIYPELLRRLTLNHECTKVAVWAKLQKLDGPCAKWTLGTWRVSLGELRKQIRRAKTRLLNRTYGKRMVLPPSPQAVHDVIAEIVTPEGTLSRMMVPSAREVWKDFDQAMQLIRAEKVLKYAFLRQQERVEKILEAENANTIPMVRLLQSEAGTKAVTVLKDIGEAIRKLEIGEEWMRGKGGGQPYGGPYPGGLLPHGPAEQSELAKGMAQFDEVDRNLMREAAMNVIEMVQGDVSAKYQASGLETDAGGAGGAQAAADTKAAGSDVAGRP